MSETVRSYSRPKLAPARRPKRRRGYFGSILLAIIVIVVIYGFWTTRDNYPVERLIPTGQAYQIVAKDLLANRAKLAESAVWGAFPESWGLAAVPDRLLQGFDVPDWVLNNLVPQTCYVSGNDLKGFSDVLFVTRMTRVGCLLERCSRFVLGVEKDAAGGLGLRRMRDTRLYYAVRGRALVASHSRDSLIRSLTLRAEDAIARDNGGVAAAGFGSEDLCGTMAFAADDPAGDVLKGASFALRVDPAAAELKCRAVLRPEYEVRVGDLTAGLAPKRLQAPPEGILGVSMDFGKPVRELWTAIGRATNHADAMEAFWQKWTSAAAPAQAFAGLISPLGPGIRLCWSGVDLNEMFPVPEVVTTIDGDPKAITEAFASLPAPPANSQPWDSYVHYDAESGRVTLPLIGGPSMQPTAGLYGDSLLVSSSRTVAESLLEMGNSVEWLPERGNLYVLLRPRLGAETVTNVLNLLAESHLLKSETYERVQRVTGPWVSSPTAFDQVSVLAGYDKGEVTVDILAACATNANAPAQ